MTRPSETLRTPVRRLALIASSALLAGMVVGSGAAGTQAAPLNGCYNKDNGDPKLTVLHVPAMVDVRSKAKVITLTAKAKDTGGPGHASGVSGVSVSLNSPTGGQYLYGALRKKGTSWSGKVIVPKGTEPGTWAISYVTVDDKAGQTLYLQQPDLQAGGFPTSLTVKSNRDTTKPTLTRFSFTPKSVNTTAKTQQVTVTATVNEKQSGLAYASVVFTGGATGGMAAYLRHVSGTTYRGSAVVPTWVGTKTWKVSSVQLVDNVQNYTSYSYAKLGTLHFPRTLRVVSGSDGVKPTKRSYARTPGTLDVRKTNKSVDVTVRATDAKSGVSNVFVSFAGPRGFGAVASMHRVSGTVKDGVWKGSARIVKCFSAPGKWKATVVVYDMAGNYRSYRAGTITVKAGDHGVPVAKTTSSIGVSDPILVRFNEDVNGIDTSSVTLREQTYPTQGPPVSGTWTCQNASGGTANCLTGKVRKATFTPSAPLNNNYYQVELNPNHSLKVTDLAGNPFDRTTLSVFTH